MRHLTKADKDRGSKLREFGCVVCALHLIEFTEAAIHHIDGQTKPGCHDLTIPLCHRHHQLKSNTGEWVSRHGDGRAAFEDAYGTEQELLELVNEAINV
jgi:hypothetical protein